MHGLAGETLSSNTESDLHDRTLRLSIRRAQNCHKSYSHVHLLLHVHAWWASHVAHHHHDHIELRRTVAAEHRHQKSFPVRAARHFPLVHNGGSDQIRTHFMSHSSRYALLSESRAFRSTELCKMVSLFQIWKTVGVADDGSMAIFVLIRWYNDPIKRFCLNVSIDDRVHRRTLRQSQFLKDTMVVCTFLTW